MFYRSPGQPGLLHLLSVSGIIFWFFSFAFLGRIALVKEVVA